jgi:signal peptidase I
MAENRAGNASQHITAGNPPSTVPDVTATAPAAAVAKQAKGTTTKAPAEPKDSLREVIETIVFVVVLVLMLKSFTAEAFVIPTGSMAETLYGYQKMVTCPECGHRFPVNCSEEVERTPSIPTRSGICPNCMLQIALESPPPFDLRKLVAVIGAAFFGGLGLSWCARALVRQELSNRAALLVQIAGTAALGAVLFLWVYGPDHSSRPVRETHPGEPPTVTAGCESGDRVLVAKFLYDTRLRDLERFDVVVFKFPEEPQRNHIPKNYIKRLMGLEGETIGIRGGDVYVAQNLPYDGPNPDERRLPVRRQMHKNDPHAVQLLEEGSEKFQIVRKPPQVLLALRRLVYDNDHQARDLLDLLPPRWAPEKDPATASPDYRTAYVRKRELAAGEKAWVADGPHGFKHGAGGGELAWLRYRHLAQRPTQPSPEAPCEQIVDFMGYNSLNERIPALNWVGDLILECEVTAEQGEGDLVLELSKSVDRFQAVWQLPGGLCTLYRIDKDGKRQELDKKDTPLKGPGTHRLRFANIDQRLTLWVDGKLPFGDGTVYEPARNSQGRPVHEFYEANDYEPASIGARGAGLAVCHLRLFRDTYYTNQDQVQTMYVQPGHYLCLGDNSPQSSDSRSWDAEVSQFESAHGGLVPKELMLGRAMLVYWPYTRFGTIK